MTLLGEHSHWSLQASWYPSPEASLCYVQDVISLRRYSLLHNIHLVLFLDLLFQPFDTLLVEFPLNSRTTKAESEPFIDAQHD